MGKAYVNKKPTSEQPKGNLYHTPMSCVWSVSKFIHANFNTYQSILEPANGNGAIAKSLAGVGIKRIITNDLYTEPNSYDYLEVDWGIIKQVITNPPFTLWDEFVEKAKTHCDRFMFIGRLNYLGTHGRNKKGLWKHLKHMLVFDRYIDYQTPYREDGLFHVGAMATAWFYFDMSYNGESFKTSIVDVQEWAKLGNFNKESV